VKKKMAIAIQGFVTCGVKSNKEAMSQRLVPLLVNRRYYEFSNSKC